jgi:uncharacterized protein YndB with AHSA1/START domain
MRTLGALTLDTRGDRELVFTRAFNAPRHLVFEAITTPALVQQWLGVHNGWSLAVCEIDLRVGGRYRYEWRHPKGMAMGMGGTYLEVLAPSRIVATERFDEHWYPGDAIDTTELVEVDGVTHMTMIVKYESPEALQAALQTPMETGMALGFDALDIVVGRMRAGR